MNLSPENFTAERWAGPFQYCPARPGRGCTFEIVRTFENLPGTLGQVTVEQCTGCGIGVTQPAIRDISALYANRTSQDFQPDAHGLSFRIKQLAYYRQAKRLLAMSPAKANRIVDYGCGSAIFTTSLADAAEGATVFACDFHLDAPPHLRNARYHSFDEIDGLAGTIDLVIALHVLEHDEHPGDLLRRMASLLKPGGHLLLEVPNIDCVWAGIFGDAWDGWYVPYHRLHFSRASLRAVVDAAGLRIVKEEDASVPTMGRTVANLLGTGNSLPMLILGAGLHPIQAGLEKLTRRPSALRLLAERPRD